MSISELEPVFHLDNTEVPYAQIPNEFIRNENLSAEARALGMYLRSHVSTWKPRPTQLKKHFKWGDYKWRKVTGELRTHGYLYLLQGSTGRDYYFSIFKNPPTVTSNVHVIHKPCVENQRMGYPQAMRGKPTRGKSTHIRTPSCKKTISIKQQQHIPIPSEGPVAVDLEIIEEMEKIGIDRTVATNISKLHKKEYLQRKIALAKSKPRSNLAGFTIKAIEQNYPEPTKTVQTEIPSTHASHVLADTSKADERKRNKSPSMPKEAKDVFSSLISAHLKPARTMS
jgi:hypothetical protein